MPDERSTFGEVLDLRASERGEQVYLWHDSEPVTFAEAAGTARAAVRAVVVLRATPTTGT